MLFSCIVLYAALKIEFRRRKLSFSCCAVWNRVRNTFYCARYFILIIILLRCMESGFYMAGRPWGAMEGLGKLSVSPVDI